MSGRIRSPRTLLRRAAAVVLGALVVSMAWPDSQAPELYAGAPNIVNVVPRLTVHTLRNPGFLVGYSEWRREALWVAFRAQAPGARPLHKRPDHFTVDERTWARVSGEEFANSGYDRGHLAPNYLIGKLYGPDAQRATFLMSNVAPQKPRLNTLVWQRLEEAEADIVAPAAGELWVTTGPVFAADGESESLGSGVRVPRAFYRIWLDPQDDGSLHLLAFVVPQEVCGTEPLSKFLVTVDEVEQQTGLDFFPELDAAVQAKAESGVERAGWDVERWERQPPRYADRFKRLDCPN